MKTDLYRLPTSGPRRPTIHRDFLSAGAAALLAALLVSVQLAIPSRGGANDQPPSGFDKAWGYATLYENVDNGWLQKLALTGRIQIDAAWFKNDENAANLNDENVENDDRYDDITWRRFRIGFKSSHFEHWVLHCEGDFDLNEDVDNWYNRLTDAYVGWSPNDHLTVKALKQSAGFTLGGATSSKKLITLQRNNLTNSLWFTSEYFTGLLAKGKVLDNWRYKIGGFSSDGDEEISDFDAGYFGLVSLGYDLSGAFALDKGLIRADYVYNDEHEEADTRDFSQVLSLVTQWQMGPWGLWTDISAGKGIFDQSDVWGLVVMPFYDISRHHQLVVRYTFLSSDDANGLRLNRYESKVVSGRGDEYNELYAGYNLYFYGHKLKWQTGLQYTDMKDDARDGGQYQGWGLSTTLRISY